MRWTSRRGVALGAAALTVGALAGCTGGDDAEPASTGPVAPEASAAPETPGSSAPSSDAHDSGTGISHDEAARIAVEKWGGTVKGVEEDHHNGEPTWEVELRDSWQGRIEVEVSRATGEIVTVEPED